MQYVFHTNTTAWKLSHLKLFSPHLQKELYGSNHLPIYQFPGAYFQIISTDPEQAPIIQNVTVF